MFLPVEKPVFHPPNTFGSLILLGKKRKQPRMIKNMILISFF